MNDSDSDSDSERWSGEIDAAIHNLTDDMNEYFTWRDETNQRLDNIETGMNHLHALLIAPNIANNNVPGAGGGKRKRKRKTKKRRRKKRTKRRK